jgi:hypothetical protein
LPGSAAKAARRELREPGFDTSMKQKTFRVRGYEGPLLDGKIEPAITWVTANAAPESDGGPIGHLSLGSDLVGDITYVTDRQSSCTRRSVSLLWTCRRGGRVGSLTPPRRSTPSSELIAFTSIMGKR